MSPTVRVVVCGAGFIGKNLIRHLLADGMQVVVVDHNDCPEEFQGCVRWLRGDFADKRLMIGALGGADVAYHLVSTTVPGDDHVGLIRELSDNIFSTIQFVEACRSCGVGRIVFMSSSSVYGVQGRIPTPEDAATNPISSHGIHKLTIEKYLLLHRHNFDVDTRIVRASNPFGPGQNLNGRQGFVGIALGDILHHRPVALRGGGSSVRDFIYIDDLGRALVMVGHAEEVPAVLNVGTGIGHSLWQVLQYLQEIRGVPVETVSGSLRKGDIPESVLDISLVRRALGFEPCVSLREGLRRTLAFHGMLNPDQAVS